MLLLLGKGLVREREVEAAVAVAEEEEEAFSSAFMLKRQ